MRHRIVENTIGLPKGAPAGGDGLSTTNSSPQELERTHMLLRKLIIMEKIMRKLLSYFGHLGFPGL